jgi:hypothetical protein
MVWTDRFVRSSAASDRTQRRLVSAVLVLLIAAGVSSPVAASARVVLATLGAQPATALVASAAVVPAIDEKFEKTDPYSLGRNKELERAGYLSFGPFPLAEGIKTTDVEETLGGIPMLWVETAHFKLGSTLVTYHCAADERERKLLREEIDRLVKKLPRARSELVKLDPWLRLHLYAQRLEEQYADFETRFGLSDADFATQASHDPLSPSYMGPGPYLGMEMKFTVLITEKRSQVARFAKRWLNLDDFESYRRTLPGGSFFFGTSAEAARVGVGNELDSALYACVAGEMALNLCDGFRGNDCELPLWFKHGLGLVYARRADERWTWYFPIVAVAKDEEPWRWEPRVHGLVTNDFAPKWDDMFGWQDVMKLDPRQRMSAWSRVAWLLGNSKANLRTLLLALSQQPCPAKETGQQSKALSAAFGKTPAQLDEAWRKWVLKTYKH